MNAPIAPSLEPWWMKDWNPQYKADYNQGYEDYIAGIAYTQLHTQGWKDGWWDAQEENV